MDNINVIIYVSPIIDNSNGQYVIDYVEMVKSKLVVKEASFDTLTEADNVIKTLKKLIRNI